jgi:hypothetical protein
LKVKAECRYYKLDESTYENYVSETKQLTGSVDFKDGKVVDKQVGAVPKHVLANKLDVQLA